MPEQAPSQIGPYRIVGVVGRWEQGWLYRAHGDRLGCDLWIKRLDPSAVINATARNRFWQEARITGALAHPNVIEIKGIETDEGWDFMVFEELTGKTFREVIKTGISLKAGLPVSLQVLDGLAAIPGAGIVHRDIKPANIFVCADGRAKITNFWLAKLTQPMTKRTSAGQIVGTPSYMSPEAALGEAVDGRTDLFSLGCVIYELVAGKKPFHGVTPVATMFKIIQDDPDMGLMPDAPEWKRLRGVITRALQKKQENRHPDAGAMHADLQRALEELGESADWVPVPSRDAAGPRMH
jgi:eukaryotic-like serine/threonine-protein kinase